jgi:hypothetical protein
MHTSEVERQLVAEPMPVGLVVVVPVNGVMQVALVVVVATQVVVVARALVELVVVVHL